MFEEAELEFIELAKRGPRRVQSPEGAKFYGLPIGSVITADVIKAKRAEAKSKGQSAPKGALSGGASVADMAGDANVSAPKSSALKDVASTGVQYKPASISGPNGFTLGEVTYSAPAGSKLIKPKGDSPFAYVLTPNNEVHAFTKDGEAEIPEFLVPVLTDKFKNLKNSDPLYEVQDFDAAQEPKLSVQKPGATLNKGGAPVFTKTAEGNWENPDLGITLTDDDLQGPFDAGTFELKPANVQDVDYSKMSLDELTAALEALPEGHQLGFSNAVLTKTKDQWVSSLTGSGTDTGTLAAITQGTSFLSQNLPAPAEPEKPKAKKNEPEDPLMDPDTPKTPDNEQKRKAKANRADGAVVTGASDGDILFHDQLGPMTKIYGLDEWQSLDAKYVFSTGDLSTSANNGFVSLEPWNTQQKADSDLYLDALEVPEEEVKKPLLPENAPDEYDLNDAMPGATVTHAKQGILTMEDDGNWYNEYAEPFFSTQELLDENAAGLVTDLQANPEFDEPEEETAPEEPEAQAPGTMSTEQVQAAIASLEDHTGFQISYGLKALPEDHPLKDKEYLDSLVAQAKEQNPGTSPKKAFVQYLKEGIGFQDEPEAAESVDEGPQILIGSESAKSTQTGMTGGSFSKKDIQAAVDILEAYQGKVFKSELNKQGNPLGQLSPNDIVGFNKDKTITKQKFLDLLKSKLDTPEPVTPEPVGDVVDMPAEPLADWELELLNGFSENKTFKPGDFITSTDEMDDFPVGTVLHWESDNEALIGPPHDYIKNEDGSWDAVDGAKGISSNSFGGAIKSKFVTYKSGPEDTPEVDLPEVPYVQGDNLPDEDSLDSLPLDTTISVNGTKFIKKSENWNFINPDGEPNMNSTWEPPEFKTFFKMGTVKYDAAPGEVHKEDAPGVEAESPDIEYSEQEYTQAPESAAEQVGVEQSKTLTAEDLNSMSGLTVFKHKSGVIVYQKMANGSYTAYALNDNSSWVLSDGDMADALKDVPDLYESFPEPQNPHKLQPGKYLKGGKTALFINEDGTGVYAGLAGKTTALDVAGVKKKWDEGFNIYAIDKVGPPKVSTEESLSTSPSTKKSVGDISQLPDGKYFLGVPTSPKAQVFEVAGAEVSHTKPKSSWGEYKLGQKPDSTFVDTAPVGSQVSSKYFADVITKQEDGTWKSDSGTEGYLKGWYLNKYRIESLGQEDSVKVTKASLKTKFLTGKLLDSTGTSVLPKNYSGNLYWFGAGTDAITLLKAKKFLSETGDTSVGTVLKNAGLGGMDAVLGKAKLLEVYDEYTPANVKKYFSEHIDATLDSLDTTVPDVDTTKLFNYDELGYALPPEGLVSFAVPNYYYASASEATQVVKTISAMFGDGKVIGQLPGTMDKQQKLNWASYVKAGNFKQAYNVEFNAAVSSGKSLPQGYAHPGYPDNSETHNVKWGAAVAGELPAGVKVEGTWSDPGLDWSMDETNNYLIKAQMQNPTYLTGSQKHAWAIAHLTGDKETVDSYSSHAKQLAAQGAEPKSPPLSWTDDVKPVKSYDKYFQDTDFPTQWDGYGGKVAAFDWFNDNKDSIPELQANAETYGKDTWGMTEDWESWGESYKKATALAVVKQYFQVKHEAYEAEKLIPVYTKEAGQTKGSHPGAYYTDQFGNKFYAKWWDYEDQLSNYRLEIEHAGNLIGRAFGFKTANSKLVNQDGHYMQLQSKVDGIGDLTGFDYSTISPTMLADIEGEHMLDWLLQNDDTKADNAIVTSFGNVVGIDKARSFKDYGVVDWNHDAPDGNLSIYTRLYDAISHGDVSKETMDAAYNKLLKTARRMQKADNEKFFKLIEEGSANRPSWTIGYQIDGKTVSQDVEGLKAAFADQKSKLVEKVESEWAVLYKKAGYGEPPEVVVPALAEGIISGMDSPELHEQVFQSKASGKTAMIGGSQVIGGTVLVWNEQDETGSQQVMGEAYLAPKAQEEALAFFTKYAGESAPQVVSTSFANYDTYQNSLISAAKTVNQHFDDKAYNASTIGEFDANMEFITNELAEWSSTLQSNSSANGLDAYKFKTGRTVPMEHLPQYKLMLEYYSEKYTLVKNAYDKQEKAPVVNAYTTIAPAAQTEILTSSDGTTKLVSMAQGKWLVSNESGVSLQELSGDEISALKSEGYTSSLGIDTPEEDGTPLGAVFTKNSYTHEKHGTHDPKTNVKVVNYASVSSGAEGQEFQATLPTGEKIYWRNADHTNTSRGQHGKLSFHIPNTGEPTAVAASMARIQEFMSVMGIDNHAADHTDAELTYWREMYSILENRNHEGAKSEKFFKVYSEMKKKVKEVGGKENQFLENLSASMTPDEEVQYWRDLWSTQFAEKVTKLVDTEGYLPKFDHQNIQDPDLSTGKPYWERFDVTFDELMERNAWLGHSSGNTAGNLDEIEHGGLLGGEERIRQLGKIFTGGGYGSSSPISDQNNGASHQIYTRLVDASGLQHYNYVLSPRLMLRTRTYVLTGDQYGKLDSRKSDTQSDLMDLIDNHMGAGGELMTPHMATVLDGVEFIVFEEGDQSKREAQIQKLKALGLETIRGLPIEERLVMRMNLQASIQKVKETWKQTT